MVLTQRNEEEKPYISIPNFTGKPNIRYSSYHRQSIIFAHRSGNLSSHVRCTLSFCSKICAQKIHHLYAIEVVCGKLKRELRIGTSIQLLVSQEGAHCAGINLNMKILLIIIF